MKKAFLRLAAFLLGFALLIAAANRFFVKTDTFAALSMNELKHRDDIELAIVGSSVVHAHFNAELITELTGLRTFSAGFSSAGLQASLAVTEELFRHSSPEWVVLVTEPFTLNMVKELEQAQYELMPHLSSPAIQLRYLLRTAREDGAYIDRLFMFRQFGAESLSDVAKSLALHLCPEKAYAAMPPTGDPDMRYMGGGFVRVETDKRADDMVKEELVRACTGYDYNLMDGTKEMLLQYRALCEAHGAKLLVLAYPNMTALQLARPDFLPYNASLRRFCDANGIPFANFVFAKPELYPRQDDLYFDLYHMVGEGADVLSTSFSRYFNALRRGEDQTALFYENEEQYLASIDCITNTWIQTYVPGSWNAAWEQNEQAVSAAAAGKDVYLANCNHVTLLTPEYRFSLVGEDGTAAPLTPWHREGMLVCAPGALTGKTLLVEARPEGRTDVPPVFYTWRPGIDPEPDLAN